MKELSIISNFKRFNPDFYKWIIWIILVLAYTINYFHSLSMGVIKESLITEFSMSETMFVTIANTYSILYLIMQIPTGILVDTIGPQKTAATGTLISAIGITLFSLTNSISLLFIGRSLVGLGTSVIFVCILKIQSSWFNKEQLGTMTGITCFIGTLGGAIAQTPLAYLVQLLGWRSSFMIIGVLSFITAISIYLFVIDSPNKMHCYNSNDELNSVNLTKIDFRQILTGLVSILKNPRTWPPLLAYAGFYGSFVILAGYWGTSFLSKVYNITNLNASLFTTVCVVGSAFGAVIIGKLSDKILSRKKPMIFSGILYALSWLILIFTMGKLPLSVMMILMFFNGFMSYGYVVSWSAVQEVNNPNYIGISTAVANIGGFLGSILIPLVVGLTFDKISSSSNYIQVYTIGFSITFFAVILSVIASFTLKETHGKNIYK